MKLWFGASGQFEPTLDAIDTFGKAVHRDLMAGLIASQVRYIPAHGCDADLDLREAGLDLFQLTLDSLLPGLKPLQVLKDEIFDSFGHGGIVSLGLDESWGWERVT
jgi:hypothetical protein